MRVNEKTCNMWYKLRGLGCKIMLATTPTRACLCCVTLVGRRRMHRVSHAVRVPRHSLRSENPQRCPWVWASPWRWPPGRGPGTRTPRCQRWSWSWPTRCCSRRGRRSRRGWSRGSCGPGCWRPDTRNTEAWKSKPWNHEIPRPEIPAKSLLSMYRVLGGSKRFT